MIQIQKMVETLMQCKEFNSTDPGVVKAFVSKMVHSDMVIYEQEAFAFYVKCSDDMLAKIQANPGFILDANNLIEVLRSTGDNVHFFGILSTKTNGVVTNQILKGIQDTIEKEHPKTISWWNKGMNRFNTRRISCHRL
jgi:hypothetical protein